MIKYINQSGQEVEINDSPANIAAAEKAGWVAGSTKEGKSRLADRGKKDKEDAKFFKAQSKGLNKSEEIFKADEEKAQLELEAKAKKSKKVANNG